MDDLQSLEKKIQQRLKAVAEKDRLQQIQLEARAAELEKRLANFEALADDLMVLLVESRIEKLVSFFDNAELVERNESGNHNCVCRFHHTNRYPASVKLTFTVAHDATIENVVLVYDLEILPVFFSFKGHDQAKFSVDHLDRKKVSGWVDQKILAFVDTYLQLEKTDQYQQSLLVTDPVCGKGFYKRNAQAASVYEGQTYYFCSDACHEKFLLDPQKYMSENAQASSRTKAPVQDSGVEDS